MKKDWKLPATLTGKDDAYYVDGSWDLSYDDVEGIREIHNCGQPDEITEEKS